jgi:thiamine transport system permease protein
MRLKTGQSLGLSAWTRFAAIDWPAIRGTLPGLAAIIFLLAFTSFPIVLLLGGGPAVQTLEVAIYSAVRLDFDLNAAVMLALVQIAICAAIILASAAFAPLSTSLDRPPEPRWREAQMRSCSRASCWCSPSPASPRRCLLSWSMASTGWAVSCNNRPSGTAL